MKKWLRWQGIAAFAVVAALLAAFWFLVVDRVIKGVIESAGTKMVGAKVELAAADLSLFPLGLTLSRLQVTDPDQPLTNALEIARIAGALDGLNLLRRKVIVEELAVDGMAFGTPRKTSGALRSAPPKKETAAGGGFSLPGVSLRDPRAILASEKLESLQLAETLQREAAAEKERWQKNLAALPDQAKLKEYQQRLEKLKSAGQGGIGGVLGGVGEAAKLQDDLTKDLNQLRSAKQDLEKSTANLRKRYDEAAKAPGEDLRRLMDKYALSGAGLTNLSASLLGGQIGHWLRTGLAWRAKAEPLLARVPAGKPEAEVVKPLRGKGVDVRFREKQPLPDFLIRTARVSLEIPAGKLSGQVRNLTPDQPVLGAPLTFQFAGEKLKGIGSVALSGEINRVRPDRPVDQATLAVVGAAIRDYTLGGNGGLTLKQGTASLDAKVRLAGKDLSASFASELKGLQMSLDAAKPEAGPIAAAVAGVLGDVRAFKAQAAVTGTVENYDVKLTSDLDQVLQNAVGRQVKAQLDTFQKGLQAAIAEKVKGPLAGAGSELGGIEGVGRELAGRLNLGEGLLKSGSGGKSGGLKLPF
ncbi:MAG: TIGR03545 family protein [Deltaproteobacteria bacterium]|nr:TIGR03545 family protein [Deltaproteobacteria bacterium]